MEHCRMTSRDLVQDNIDAIGQLFPNCIKEVQGEDGKPEHRIDFDALKQELSRSVIEGRPERYEFNWPGKRAAALLANTPIQATLRPCREESVNFDTTENLYIEGDNLDVLKLLCDNYRGKVKMIYIDPPYNTGNDFVYEDDFAQTGEEYRSISGDYDDQGNRLIKNTTASGRFHTDWLNMMYPRLRIAQKLLTDDGVIFISIDDNEETNVRKLCDELFGGANFIGTIILQTSTDNNPRQINTEHEYIICYAKSKTHLEAWCIDSDKAKMIQVKYEELKREYKDDITKIQAYLRKWIKQNEEALEGVAHYDNVDEKGVFHDGDIANTIFGGYRYEVIHPITGKPCKIPEKGFRFTESTMREMLANNNIMFGADETTLIKPKKRLENAKELLRSVIYEDGRASTKQFETLMARDIFQNPKSPMILEKLISYVVKPSDIVIDFFSGSGTTAEAVFRHNAHSNSDVKFILVQIDENLDKSLDGAETRAKKTLKNAIDFLNSIGKPHSICEIGKERIRRAGAKIATENATTAPNLDIGFRVLKLDSSNMTDVYYSPEDLKQGDLFAQADNVKADRTAEDLLFQVMLEKDIPLSSKIETEIVAGKTIFNVAGGYLLACFDTGVTDEVVTAIAKKQPVHAVFRDAGMATDSTAINFEQIFASYSPDTKRAIL